MNERERQEIVEAANRLAEVRDWYEIPGETYAGICGVIDDLNNLISK